MNVSLLFFAAARDAVGRSREEVELPPTVRNVEALSSWLAEAYPPLRPYLGCVRIARNEVFAEPDTVLAAGDELAIIPPVAGG
ncbi:MAG: molybdopterin converting factor subunit 1 [Polyangiaceae bacterium]